jgi:hypothetical protein
MCDELLAAAQREGRSGSPSIAFVFQLCAEAALAVGDASGAEEHASQFYSMAAARTHVPETSADVGKALLLRAKARRAQGNVASAVADLNLAIPSLVKGLGESHPDTVEAGHLLAQVGRYP